MPCCSLAWGSAGSICSAPGLVPSALLLCDAWLLHGLMQPLIPAWHGSQCLDLLCWCISVGLYMAVCILMQGKTFSQPQLGM